MINIIIFNIIVLEIGIIALIIAYFLFRKIGFLILKDKEKCIKIIEGVSAGLLATIMFVIFQRYIEAVKDIPQINFDSFSNILYSLLIILGNLFISTTIMLAVVFFAIYMILKSVLGDKNKLNKKNIKTR